MKKITALLRIAQRVGLNRDQLEALIIRMLQFLILDYAVSSVALLQRQSLDLAPVRAQDVYNWFRGRGCNYHESPSVADLATFLSIYHKVRARRPTTVPRFNEGCRFPGGCVYSDPHAAKLMGIRIEADHIVPVSRGGVSTIWEFQPLCQPHNLLRRRM
jgi:5-methylcytosine-specific restriction endonuclease McrA